MTTSDDNGSTTEVQQDKLEDWIKETGKDFLNEEEINKDAVTVLRKVVEDGRGAFGETIKTVKLFVELSRVITVHPLGPEAFGECAHQLIIIHNPFEYSTALVSVSFESDERAGLLGSFFGKINEITPDKIVNCLENSEDDLELNIPRISINIVYINAPSSL